jgi:DNA replicative helicase MCM subunit Mcm2 (Cdc46/Mcm family)
MNFDINQFKKQLLVLSFFGIFLIFFISLFITEKNIEICQINETQTNDLVKTEGIVISEKMISDKTKILTLTKDKCSVEVLAQTRISFENQNIIVKGKISTYQNKKQITAEKIYLKEK